MTLWDVDTGMAVNEYEAHDKRIWSVDFCTADSSLFVSGSDDGWIKVGLISVMPPLAKACNDEVAPISFYWVVSSGRLQPSNPGRE